MIPNFGCDYERYTELYIIMHVFFEWNLEYLPYLCWVMFRKYEL